MAHALPRPAGVEPLNVVLNPHAGGGAADSAERLRNAFSAAGTHVRISAVPGAGVADAVAGLLREGASSVAVAGGDGTLSAAAAALAGTQVALLPLPLGTLNHFARRYGVSGIEAAVHAWQDGHVQTVAVGYLNERVFINNASCGFYPHLVRHRRQLEGRIPRSLANWVAGLRVLVRLPIMQLELVTPTETMQLQTPALWVGLGRKSLRLPGERARVHQADVLEIITPRTRRRRDIIGLSTRTLFRLRLGAETPEDPLLEVLHAPRFTLAAPHRIDVGIDGEAYRIEPPLHFRIERNGLRLLCPAERS